ncbi:protein NnrU [Rhodospirillum rubrum]|uniref:NnrU family protein n=1 Tax=Rhodospirillum rubrum TaxID=1085 RepID=UPI0019038B96|nr:NnrU family protein [Rhodospirillum rubrum]MBK1664939.1 protein NnrU [Rhodospirillum rubrum]MBK1678477.1 protein NnrU [Rhodospirillum rubrum]
MDGFWQQGVALTVFLGTHAIAALPGARGALRRRLGEGGYLVGYSGLSLALLVWLTVATLGSPFVALWPPQPFAAVLLVAVMPGALILLVAALTEANPFSLGFSGRTFDPRRPQTCGRVAHPLFMAFGLWAGLHLLANGDVAGALYFGPLLVLALVGPAVASAKAKARYGAVQLDLWRRAARAASPTARLPALRTWIGGLLLYGAILSLHGPLIGLDPRDMLP